MGLFNKKNSGPKPGLMDVIRCDEPNYLIWKWHPAGAELGEHKRENSIRWNSSLRVKDGEVAVFVYKQKDGTMQDFIEGPYDETLKTANFPVLASIVGAAYGGDSPLQAEVYFINLAHVIQVKFAVPFFDIFDPRAADFGVPVAVRGTISFKISDYRDFIKMHRLINFNLEDFQNQIKDAVVRYTKSVVANVPVDNGIPVVQIERKLGEINEIIEAQIQDRLKKDFGVEVSGVDISSIELDKSSDGYKELMAITKNVTSDTVKAQTAATVKNISDKQRIEAEHYDESLRVAREEGQYAQHKQTQTANLQAFQTEKQAEVGVAGAEALGKMGSNGAGNINLGNGGGFNVASMMTGMAVGGVVGRNIAGSMNDIMSGNNPAMPTPPSQNSVTPPPIPNQAFYIAVDGQQTGPHDLNALAMLILKGQLKADTLVWKNGMSDWTRADAVAELKELLDNANKAS